MKCGERKGCMSKEVDVEDRDVANSEIDSGSERRRLEGD
jgi:hypothetical protein